MAPRLQENLGQQIVVENRSGAGGMVGADIVMTSGPITKVRAPQIEAPWLAPGSLLISLDRDSYVTDEAIRSMDRIFSDDREALMHSKEHEYAFGAVERVDADLAEIAPSDMALRHAPDERIGVFVNGLGIEDLAAAVEAYKMARERDVGELMPAQFE